MSIILPNILISIFFLTVVFLHNTNKISNISLLYFAQSFTVVVSMFLFYLDKGQTSLLLIAILDLIVKVIVAPISLINFSKRNKISFSDGYYMNMPLSLIVIAGITVFTSSEIFSSLTHIIPANSHILALALASIFISILLIINSKSALLQIAGILSFENAIVMFSIFSELEQSFGLQIGILFDISIWIIISIVLSSMIYKNIGSLNTNKISHLTD